MHHFLSQEVGVPEDEELGKKVLKSIHYESAPPDVQKNIMDARTKEWNKFLEFAAVIEISKEDAERLIAEGHQCIPSKWVDVDKNQFMKKNRPRICAKVQKPVGVMRQFRSQ